MISPENKIESSWEPFDKQQLLFAATNVANTTVVCCGNRAGKTASLIEKMAIWAEELGRPDNRGVIISTNHTVIEDNIINEFMLRWSPLVKSYNSVKHSLEFNTGHKVWCISPENPYAIEGKSRVAYVLIDEPITVPVHLYNMAYTRAVDCDAPFLIVGSPIVWDLDKPPIGIEWFKDIYLRGKDPAFCGRDVPKSDRIISLNWGMADNPHIPKKAIEKVKTNPLMSATEKRARLYGEFAEMEETMFPAEMLTPQACGYNPGELTRLQLKNYMTVDPALGKKRRLHGDDAVILTAGIGPNYTIYVRECLADRYNPDQAEKLIIDRYSRFMVQYAGIESVALWELYADKMRKSQLHDGRMRFKSLTRHGGVDAKPLRWARLVPFVENGRIKFPLNSRGGFDRGCEKLVHQMTCATYEGTGKEHDDCLDALADILNPEMKIFKGYETHEQPKPQKQVENPLLTRREFALMKRKFVARSLSFN